MEVKCFVMCTDLLLPLKVNFSYFEIQNLCYYFWNPNPEMQKYAIQSGIRIRRTPNKKNQTSILNNSQENHVSL